VVSLASIHDDSPMAELISIERARELIAERVRRTGSEGVVLREALGRVLAAPVSAVEDVPGFDNSAMDGYAVRAADTAGAAAGDPRRLPVVDEARAGHPADRSLGAGEAIAISTGAMLPAGADAVVRVEDTSREESDVLIGTEVPEGKSIRRAGEDVRAGARLIPAGTRIGAAELGALAAVGVAEATCARRPRLTVLLTGDELVEPGEPLGPGQIRDSNAYSVPPLAAGAGGEVTSVNVIGDDLDATVEALRGALEADVTVLCGGVSVGEHDHVRAALGSLDVEEVFWGVALRPGKPTYFGVAPGGGLVFGLPGNPVSAMVTFVLFARPAVLAMQGASATAERISAQLGSGHRKVAGRAEALRVRLEAGPDGWLAHPTGPQGSHVLTSMLGADGLAFAPADRDELLAGERIEVELLR
jgi:molybdopterin molybdotransferase